MISAVILAAGESKRMGQPKLLMPWGQRTVIEAVVETFRAAGIAPIIVVTGGSAGQIEALIGRSARTVFNADYRRSEMLSSLQTGLAAMGPEAEAALIGLGDQPQIEIQTVVRILQEYEHSQAGLIVPSYQRRRGHPWLVARAHWQEILQMPTGETPRDFLNRHAAEMDYVDLATASVLQDLDTPDDYQNAKPAL